MGNDPAWAMLSGCLCGFNRQAEKKHMGNAPAWAMLSGCLLDLIGTLKKLHGKCPRMGNAFRLPKLMQQAG